MYIISRTSRGGFTLIELMIAMTIFAVMSTIVLSVYLNTMTTSRKLSLQRHMTETARQITERIAEDVREEGINLATSHYDDGIMYNELWKTPEYTGSGGEILGVGSGVTQYIYAKKILNGSSFSLEHCRENDQKDPYIHCGLYLVQDSNWTDAYNLVDSFVPEEEKKRVKVERLRFYVSGDDFTTKKVTLVMTLGLMPRSGIPASMIENTKLQIQTTMSERGWKR